jgi:hypothetical protein
MIYPAHIVFVAAHKLDLQVAVHETGDTTDTSAMRLFPSRHQANGPDIIAVPCNDPEYVDVEARTDDGRLLLQLISTKG